MKLDSIVWMNGMKFNWAGISFNQFRYQKQANSNNQHSRNPAIDSIQSINESNFLDSIEWMNDQFAD